jgi:secreted trypsin-like serine protease
VIGGFDANIANYPWQLSLRVTDQHSCGAALLSGTKAVTVAHCGGGPITQYTVLAGSGTRTTIACQTCALRSLTSFVRHAGYVNDFNQGFPNDIATFRFANIAANANTGYVTMAASNAGNYAGQTCVITGWGRTTLSGPLSLTLQEGSGLVYTNLACANAWSTNQINNGHICLSSETVSACNGDNGGPMICGHTLVGVMSWDSPDCSPSAPTVATRISFFRAWIDAN